MTQSEHDERYQIVMREYLEAFQGFENDKTDNYFEKKALELLDKEIATADSSENSQNNQMTANMDSNEPDDPMDLGLRSPSAEELFGLCDSDDLLESEMGFQSNEESKGEWFQPRSKSFGACKFYQNEGCEESGSISGLDLTLKNKKNNENFKIESHLSEISHQYAEEMLGSFMQFLYNRQEAAYGNRKF